MPCYHPLLAITDGYNIHTGKRKIKILGSADNYSVDEIKRNKNGMLIPCGKCIGCRLDYSRKWADRMMLELAVEKKAVFITLTYNNDALNGIDEDGKKILDGDGSPRIFFTAFDDNYNPISATLDKRECQLWMKRLRKEFDNIRIRFYLSGEYGSPNKTFRPHYHAIIFGIGISDIGDCVPSGKNGLGQQYYVSKRIRSTWKRGNVIITDVSWQTMAYVARYVTKKLNGPLEEFYAMRNIPQKPFALMSRNPGLGADYLKLHPDALDYQEIWLSTLEGGKKVNVPKYFYDLAIKKDLISDQDYDKLRFERSQFALDDNLLRLQNTDLGFTDYLENEEYRKKVDTKVLKRLDI